MVKSLYCVEEAANEIWVYLEISAGEIEAVSLELLSRARQLADEAGWPVVGLLLGHQVEPLANQGIVHGADRVYWADHPLLDHFTIEAYGHIVTQTLLAERPSIFLLGATPDGRDLAGRLAVRLRTGLNADCTGLKINLENGVLVSEVSGFGGGVLAMIEMQEHRPQMATVRPGVFAAREPDYRRKGHSIPIAVELEPDMIQTRVIERVTGEGIDLTRAPVLVAGGRGVDGDFELLQKLAELLGGEVGGTRPPVDDGFIERERQIGQTGVVCRPRIAICCGISGAFHFVVGIEKAETVIAINTDPQAPIFEHADYCIVADVSELIPALVARLEGERETAYG